MFDFPHSLYVLALGIFVERILKPEIMKKDNRTKEQKNALAMAYNIVKTPGMSTAKAWMWAVNTIAEIERMSVEEVNKQWYRARVQAINKAKRRELIMKRKIRMIYEAA